MRTTLPNLFHAYLAYGVLTIALGLNFLFLTPTFMPLDLPKWPVGLIFLFFGCQTLVFLFLDAHSELRKAMALLVMIYLFWAGLLTFEFVRLSQTSMQLPLTYDGLAWLGLIRLSEPYHPAAAPLTLPAEVDQG